MSKKIYPVLGIVLCFLACSGCDMKNAKSNKTEHTTGNGMPIVAELTGSFQLAYEAESLQQLYDDSDFVAEINVTDTEAVLMDDHAFIGTYFTAEIISSYKGEYHGERFYSDGGYMNLGEYLEKTGRSSENSEFTDEEKSNGCVYFNCMDSHVPETGDTLIFFGKYSEELGVIYATSTGQSIYCCDEENISISFQNTSNNAMPSLAVDLLKNPDAAAESEQDVTTVSCSKEVMEELTTS